MEPLLPGSEDRAPPCLIDHLLEEIFVRIGAPADLDRASAACKDFRRLITDPTFLKRYRSLHPPLLLGFLNPLTIRGFQPVEAPHPNAPVSLAFAGAASFSFDYLPDRRGLWCSCEPRDGRVVLLSSIFEHGVVVPELALCDPLTQEYKLLPTIPDGLLASVSLQTQDQDIFFHAFFILREATMKNSSD